MSDAAVKEVVEGDVRHSKVSFTFTDLSESARLLEHQAFTDRAATSSSAEAPKEAIVRAPRVPMMLARPVDLMDAPSDVDSWPKKILRIACTHCGHYIETIMNEETEFMGCRSCFSSKPIFRRSFVHYCPNCNEPIGFHYTGEDCFCNHGKSTMTFDSVLAASCCAWMSSQP